ncbi:hypothetical protein NDU88_004952 [Pleurodeles waltl]|uniref:Uncharacterized protein n=1 Tax=Pleurodeles waltl TaxID=8319 RepID=A0AAV7TSZ7_PLEWA|nr:hypothetical protein NDU88_004952 [Pleurodeles waltl]
MLEEVQAEATRSTVSAAGRGDLLRPGMLKEASQGGEGACEAHGPGSAVDPSGWCSQAEDIPSHLAFAAGAPVDKLHDGHYTLAEAIGKSLPALPTSRGRFVSTGKKLPLSGDRTAKVLQRMELLDGEKVNAGPGGMKSDRVMHEMHAGVDKLELGYDKASNEWEESELHEESEVSVPMVAARRGEATKFSVGVLQKPRAGNENTTGQKKELRSRLQKDKQEMG